MQRTLDRLKLLEFEGRIFVSFGIVLSVCALSYLAFTNSPPVLVLVGHASGLSTTASLAIGYSCLALVMLLVSLLRMWAGSVLSPHTVMAFKVQVDALKTSGPYRIVRNPIYLADLIAMFALSLCLPLVGLVMPALFALHYHRLILFEEESFDGTTGAAFREYRSRTPRMIPTIKSLRGLGPALREFDITKEGFRHNGLFVLFVPGFVVAAFTTEFVYAVLGGLPGVIDWAIIHTKIGLEQ